MNKIERIRQAALKAGIASGNATALPMYKLEAFYDEIENQVELDISELLTVAHMDGYARGRDDGIKQERALWNLAETSKDIGQEL